MSKGKWTAADDAEAAKQGWGIFAINLTVREIQKDDEAGVFKDDQAAVAHVKGLALSGDELAGRALRIVGLASR